MLNKQQDMIDSSSFDEQLIMGTFFSLNTN